MLSLYQSLTVSLNFKVQIDVMSVHHRASSPGGFDHRRRGTWRCPAPCPCAPGKPRRCDWTWSTASREWSLATRKQHHCIHQQKSLLVAERHELVQTQKCKTIVQCTSRCGWATNGRAANKNFGRRAQESLPSGSSLNRILRVIRFADSLLPASGFVVTSDIQQQICRKWFISDAESWKCNPFHYSCKKNEENKHFTWKLDLESMRATQGEEKLIQKWKRCQRTRRHVPIRDVTDVSPATVFLATAMRIFAPSIFSV